MVVSGYDVNKAFKPAKSHAMEAELLCTYAPKEYLGTENEKKLMNVLDEAAKSFKKKQ